MVQKNTANHTTTCHIFLERTYSVAERVMNVDAINKREMFFTALAYGWFEILHHCTHLIVKSATHIPTKSNNANNTSIIFAPVMLLFPEISLRILLWYYFANHSSGFCFT